MTVGQSQRASGIKSHAYISGYEGIIREAGIEKSIRYDHHIIF